jgi:hypothetical protein
MTKPERLVAAAALAVAAAFASGAAASAMADAMQGKRIAALLAVLGASALFGLTLSLLKPLRRRRVTATGFRPMHGAAGKALSPAKYRPPLPGRHGKVTARPPERQFAELPRPGFSRPMIVHKIYPQAPVATRLDQAHLYWAMRLLSDKRARALSPPKRANLGRKAVQPVKTFPPRRSGTKARPKRPL